MIFLNSFPTLLLLLFRLLLSPSSYSNYTISSGSTSLCSNNTAILVTIRVFYSKVLIYFNPSGFINIFSTSSSVLSVISRETKKKNINKHYETEDAKDDTSLSLNINEDERDETVEREIEDLIRGNRECNDYNLNTKRVKFWRVDLEGGVLDRSIEDDEEIEVSDDGFG